MQKLNVPRFALGIAIASVLCFVSDGLLHNLLLKADWSALFAQLHATPPGSGEHEHGAQFFYFVLFELGRGALTMWLYVLMRAPFHAGAKTALLAGGIAWGAFSFTGPVQMIPLGLFSEMLWLKMGAFQLVVSLIAALAAAAPYKD